MVVASTNIGGVDVPAEYVEDVNNAAAQLGIPASIVANQINLESSFNPNAVSPAGAEGIAQFEPGTFSSYGTGSPFNASDAFAAYVKYMSALLKQEKGDIWSALEAYNAGPGNLGAGNSYAATIFSRADLLKGAKQGGTGSLPSAPNGATEGGQGAAGTVTSTGSWTSALGDAWNDLTSGVSLWPGVVIGTFGDVDKLVGDAYKGYTAFFQPSTYVRIGAGFFGFIFIIVGIICLAREAKA